MGTGPLHVFGANFFSRAVSGIETARKPSSSGNAKSTASRSEPPPVQEPEVSAEVEEEIVDEVAEPVEPEPVPVVEVTPVKEVKQKKKSKPAAPRAAPSPPSEVAASPEPQVAPSTAVTAEDSAVVKECKNKIRNVQKKLRDISDLKSRQAAGESLAENQLLKIGREAELLQAKQDAEKAMEAAQQEPVLSKTEQQKEEDEWVHVQQ